MHCGRRLTMTVGFALVLCWSLPARGQQPGADRNEAASGTVGVVDLDLVIRETGLAQKIEDSVQQARQHAEASLQRTRAELVERNETLRKRLEPIVRQAERESPPGFVPTTLPDDVLKLRNQMAALDAMFQRAMQIKQGHVQAYVQQLQGQLRADLRPLIRRVAERNGVLLVISSQVTLYVVKDLDLTADLIDELKQNPLPAIKPVPDDLAKEVDLSQALRQFE